MPDGRRARTRATALQPVNRRPGGNPAADFLEQSAQFVRNSAIATLAVTVIGIGIALKIVAEIIEEII